MVYAHAGVHPVRRTVPSRLDTRGRLHAARPWADPSDHHTIFVVFGASVDIDHAAFEVVDLDAVEMGQQVLKAAGYKHAWAAACSAARSSTTGATHGA